MKRTTWFSAWLLAMTFAPVSDAVCLPSLLSEYTVSRWREQDGSPLGQVNTIAQNTDGYLLIGTDRGLFRFDGVRFTALDTFDSQLLPKDPVRILRVGRDGTLWVGFGDGGGISRIRNGLVTNYRAAEGSPKGTINAIAEDRSGSIWAGTNQGLFRFSGNRWLRVAEDQGLAAGPVLSAYVDRRGELMVGLETQVFGRLPDAPRFQEVGALADHALNYFEGPTAMSEDADGRLCVNDSIAGFRRLGERSAAPAADRERGRGSRLLLDHHNNLWVGTGGQGVWRVRFQGHSGNYTTQGINALTGLLSDGVTALFEDRDGNIWVGTTEGLHRFTASKVTQITDIGLVGGVEVMPGGDIWVGTVDELIRFSDSTIDAPTDRITPHGKLRAMHADAHGTLWVATASYVGRMVNRRLTPVLALGHGLPHEIDSMTSDGHQGLWLHDVREGFFHWTGQRIERVPLAAGLEAMRVLTTYTDSGGRVWIAFFNGTVGVIDTAGGLRLYAAEDGLLAGPYRAIHEDRSGAIWLAGGDGLTRFVHGRFQTVRRGPGFPMLLNAVIDDGAGNLYLGSRSGIVTIREDDFDGAVTTGSFRYKLYDRSDGLAGLPLTNINNRRVIRAKDNRLWFVTARGLTVIDPQVLRDDRPSLPIRVEGVRADERSVPAEKDMALPPRTSRLEIDYTVLNLTSPLRTQFRYRLEGFDSTWIDAGSRRQAFYTNLPPGAYRFRVAASTSGGDWDERGGEWDFSIKPTFYQTMWFYLAIAIAAALALRVAWGLRLRHLRREFSLVLGERVRVSREIHDTLLQSLVGLALQFDVIANDAEAPAGTRRGQFVHLRKQVEEYIREARQSILNLRSPRLEQSDLVRALRDAGEHITSGNTVHFDFSVSGTPQVCSPRITEQLLRIGREAVTNASRHAHAQAVHMHLAYEPDAIVLRVSDDGRGFDPDRLVEQGSNHYGLVSMHERAQDVGGAVHITSQADQGTCIIASVPIQ
jgi:signal transduction histidine kinase/ligand-binding sensor domain-containing protein